MHCAGHQVVTIQIDFIRLKYQKIDQKFKSRKRICLELGLRRCTCRPDIISYLILSYLKLSDLILFDIIYNPILYHHIRNLAEDAQEVMLVTQ